MSTDTFTKKNTTNYLLVSLFLLHLYKLIENNNIMYHIGQKVVCIRGARSAFSNAALKEGKTYTIADVKACKCETILFVGIYCDGQSGTHCPKCGDSDISNKWYHYSSRFVTLGEHEKQEEAINELLKEHKIFLS